MWTHEKYGAMCTCMCSLLIEKDICDCQNISIKLLCICVCLLSSFFWYEFCLILFVQLIKLDTQLLSTNKTDARENRSVHTGIRSYITYQWFFLFSWWRPQCRLKATSNHFSSSSLDSSDVYCQLPGRRRSLSFCLTYFYHFTFTGFPFILIFTV